MIAQENNFRVARCFNTNRADIYADYALQRVIAEKVIADKFAKSAVPDVGVTTHWFNDKECVVIAMNYSGKDIEDAMLDIKPYSKCEVLHGDIKKIPVCDMTVLKIEL